MAKTHLVRDDAQAAGSQQSFTRDAAIADLNVGTLVLLTDVISAMGTMQAKMNVMLAALRNQGVIAP
jgi:pyrimidine operon attenuation protein/uracil phosphoribosyltransferase